MKIAINRCYGGFDPSMAVEKEYLRRKGKEAFFYKQTKYKHSEGVDEYIRVNPGESNYIMAFTLTKDLGEITNDLPDDDFFMMSSVERNDPDLIAALETCAGNRDTNVSKIEIVEIPDDVKYTIEDYDGVESIHEVHRSW
jgi:hypothetical protein